MRDSRTSHSFMYIGAHRLALAVHFVIKHLWNPLVEFNQNGLRSDTGFETRTEVKLSDSDFLHCLTTDSATDVYFITIFRLCKHCLNSMESGITEL